MSNKIITSVTLFVCLFLVSACATDKTIIRDNPVELPIMQEPVRTLGTITMGFQLGKPQKSEVQSVAGDKVTTKIIEGPLNLGCSWTSTSFFAPAEKFENCPESGTQEIQKSGNIWPLQVGNKESYKVKGKNDQGNSWSTTRRCEVEAAVMVSIQERQIPAYEVICKDSWNTRRFYLSPDMNKMVKFNRRHSKRGVESDWIIDLN